MCDLEHSIMLTVLFHSIVIILVVIFIMRSALFIIPNFLKLWKSYMTRTRTYAPCVSIFLNVPGHSELVISKTILPRITLLRLTKCTKIGHTSCPFRKTCSYKLKMVGDSERVHWHWLFIEEFLSVTFKVFKIMK